MASPLFGKRKDKIPQSNKSIKLNESKRKKDSKKIKSFLVLKSSNLEDKTSEILISCLRREKTHLKHETIKKQIDKIKPNCNLNLSINNKFPTIYDSKLINKMCSIQSSSGHGSECSSNLQTDQNVFLSKKSANLLNYESKKNHYYYHEQEQQHQQKRQQSKQENQHYCCYCLNKQCCPKKSLSCLVNKREDNYLCCNHQLCQSNYTHMENCDSIKSNEKRLIQTLETNRLSINTPSLNASTGETRRGGGHASSGYESIMRDSENSSHADSTSESSIDAFDKNAINEQLTKTNLNCSELSKVKCNYYCKNNNNNNILKESLLQKTHSLNKNKSVDYSIQNNNLLLDLTIQKSTNSCYNNKLDNISNLNQISQINNKNLEMDLKKPPSPKFDLHDKSSNLIEKNLTQCKFFIL